MESKNMENGRQQFCTGGGGFWSFDTRVSLTQYNDNLDKDEIPLKYRRMVKPVRVTCSVCKRRLMSSMQNDDGTLRHNIPYHKPKGWWKKIIRA